MKTPKLQRITIERLVQTQDPTSGNLYDDWEPVPGFVRIPAEVLPDRASEFFASRQIQATQNALVILRYQPGIEPAGMRVVHHVRPGDDRFFDIQGVVDFQSMQREMRLYCLWRDAQGYRRGTDLENPV